MRICLFSCDVCIRPRVMSCVMYFVCLSQGFVKCLFEYSAGWWTHSFSQHELDKLFQSIADCPEIYIGIGTLSCSSFFNSSFIFRISITTRTTTMTGRRKSDTAQAKARTLRSPRLRTQKRPSLTLRGPSPRRTRTTKREVPCPCWWFRKSRRQK